MPISTRAQALKQEKAVAKQMAMKRTANSGATAFLKGDIVGDNIIIECKTKMQPCKAFSIKEQWIKDLELERQGMGKDYKAIAFSFNEGKTNFYVITQKEMDLLKETIEKQQDFV